MVVSNIEKGQMTNEDINISKRGSIVSATYVVIISPFCGHTELQVSKIKERHRDTERERSVGPEHKILFYHKINAYFLNFGHLLKFRRPSFTVHSLLYVRPTEFSTQFTILSILIYHPY